MGSKQHPHLASDSSPQHKSASERKKNGLVILSLCDCEDAVTGETVTYCILVTAEGREGECGGSDP